MKKSILLLWILFLLTFSGCTESMKGLMVYDTDPTLKSISKVRALATLNEVGFEWEKIKDKRVHGINIYRGKPTQGAQSFERIGTVGNPYGTHYVDRNVQPDTNYLYTFTAFSLGKESNHGAILKVKTKPLISGVSFVKAYKVAPEVIKLLWSPHTNKSINRYIIERSVNNTEWKHLVNLKGQLIAEYIDTFVDAGNTYKYRIIAVSYDGIYTKASQITSISL